MISTGVFSRLGHTYRGRMVDVVAADEKLRGRASRIASHLTARPHQEVQVALAEAGGNAKVAILMLRCRLSAQQARSRLQAVDGDLAAALRDRKAS
jgi:N-acetylmuramic acid 6-phosphate etherase